MVISYGMIGSLGTYYFTLGECTSSNKLEVLMSTEITAKSLGYV